MIKLKNASLVIIDCRNYAQAISSLMKSMAQVEFEKVLFLTDIDIPNLPDGIEIKKIPSIRSKDEYSIFCIKELYKFIETDYFLLVQWDSEILDGSQWKDEYYQYDYIAPLWPFETDGLSIGCGGFSWRSKRLHEILGTDDMILPVPPEDVTICRIYRRYLEEKYGMKWPSDEIADSFAYELKEPGGPVFGKHGFFHKPYQDVVVIQRRAALGDIIHLEPLMYHFYKNGSKVVLDTLPQFFNLFIQHYFKVHHPDEIDGRLLKKARVINLDMSYESRPLQLHLKSYYELSGITDGEIRNPKLTLAYDPKIPEAKLFKKYCVLHIDKRQPGRSIFGVDWEEVVSYLHSLGYTTIQIGHGEHEVVPGATEMRNMNEPMLMRLIGGADIFIGADSGPFNIALAMDTPAIAFFGSVNPEYIIPDPKNVVVIQNHNPDKPICRNVHCWSSTIGQEGVECIEVNGCQQFKVQSMQGAECIEETDIPPCVQFTTRQVFDAINKIVCK